MSALSSEHSLTERRHESRSSNEAKEALPRSPILALGFEQGRREGRSMTRRAGSKANLGI